MPKTKPAQNAIALLKADHRKVEALFAKYKTARGKKADIAGQICMELTIHTLLEEEIFYPACKEAGVKMDNLDEAYVEHDGAKMLIAELEAGSPNDDFYDAKVKVLSEEIKHHVKEEEQPGGIFAQAKKKGLDMKALGVKMQARKDEMMPAFITGGTPAPVTRTMNGLKLERSQPVA